MIQSGPVMTWNCLDETMSTPVMWFQYIYAHTRAQTWPFVLCCVLSHSLIDSACFQLAGFCARNRIIDLKAKLQNHFYTNLGTWPKKNKQTLIIKWCTMLDNIPLQWSVINREVFFVFFFPVWFLIKKKRRILQFSCVKINFKRPRNKENITLYQEDLQRQHDCT